MASKMDLIKQRHSVRQYLDKEIPDEIRTQLDEYAEELNQAGNLHMQIIYDEPECFSARMAHYGNFENCKNYIVMAGKKASDLDERCGYYGELLVLKAQELGLNTCWVALTHGKSKAIIGSDEKEVIIIALGYGKTAACGSALRRAQRQLRLKGYLPDRHSARDHGTTGPLHDAENACGALQQEDLEVRGCVCKRSEDCVTLCIRHKWQIR